MARQEEPKFEYDLKKDLGAEEETDYLASVREKMQREKSRGENPHWENINIDELTDQDVMLFDDFARGILGKEDLLNYWRDHQSEAEESGGKFIADSRRNLLAMILNRFIGGEGKEKHLKKYPEDRDNLPMAA
jgi:hypothetical protein